ncbi:MAG: transglycosylase SLT domain-containing protein, partial [Chloroflexi bacterium]|nr:transglycosylase SLT domain-containing protein [Chloroflexota bacterium]
MTLMRYWLICAVVLIGAILLLGSLGVSDSPPDAVTRWWELIEPAADQYKVDPVLIAAIMMQESGGNPNAQSRAGANGLM